MTSPTNIDLPPRIPKPALRALHAAGFTRLDRFNALLIHRFGASAKHCAFYLMNGSTVGDYKMELRAYDTSKGTIRFQPDRPLPVALVRKLVKARIEENSRLRNKSA